MKADISHYLPVASSPDGPRTTRTLWLALSAICLVLPVTTGCHFLSPHQTAAQPHYGRLEQACFGYEPTIWRSLGEDCEQAIRLIPDQPVELPPDQPAESEPAAEPEEPGTDDSLLNLVPEPDRGVPGIVRPFLENQEPPQAQPPMPDTAPPDAAPSDVAPPDAAPSDAAPSDVVPPDAAPLEPPMDTPGEQPAEPPSDVRQSRQLQVRPISVPSVARSAPRPVQGAAHGLFQSVEQALATTPAPSGKRAASQDRDRVPTNPATGDSQVRGESNGTIGLARFIQ